MASEIAEKVHSPLPWREGYFGIVAADGIAAVEDHFLRDVNAELIVKAVNNHQRLLDALKEAVDCLDGWISDSGQADPNHALKSFYDVIAAAEGREL